MFRRIALVVVIILATASTSQAQLDSLIERIPVDTSQSKLNMDASYNRPFLTAKKAPISIGGYIEANTLYSSVDGVSEGLSFQARRLTIFMSSNIGKRLKFLSEIEFEEGGKEIAIEFAALDVALLPALNFRGGIFMNPIGAFNQNHDGPKWEFVERPDVAVSMLPATWSNAGFGIFGKTYSGKWILGYEAYFSNGFDASIIDNEANRTSLPATKENEERFTESSNGEPLFSGKIAIKNRSIGEIGFSYMGGVYNDFEPDGVEIDEKRRVDVFAIDINTEIKKTGTRFIGEVAFVHVDVPDSYTQQYGSKQQGFFLDVVQPVLKRKVLDWDNAVLNVAARLDYVDWNVGTFDETDTNIGDQIWAITPAVSFRPSARTVFRINYRYQWQRDILDNEPALGAAWMFGFSTYF